MGIPQAASSPARRRSDAGRVRLQQRDIDGLLLIADHYTAPHDLLAQALAASPARVRSIAARWRGRVHRDRRPLPPPQETPARPKARTGQPKSQARGLFSVRESGRSQERPPKIRT